MPVERPDDDLRTLGEALLGLGEPTKAADALERARASVDEHGDRGRVAWIDGLLGRALVDSGRDPARGRALVAGAWAVMQTDDRMEAQRASLAAWMKRRNLAAPR